MDRPNWYPTGTMPKPFLPRTDLDAGDLAFGAASKITEMLPPVEDIPEEIAHAEQEWYGKLFGDLFYSGVENLQLHPKEGIDPKQAWDHLTCIMGSFAPKHEYKEAAWFFLANEWFNNATWNRKTK